MGRMMKGTNFVKYMLIVFNLVFMIFSLLLIGLGVAVSFKWPALIELLPMGDKLIHSMTSWVPWMMFFVGLIMFLISILGCYGASNEIYWALVTYAIILFAVIILQVILGVLVYFGIIGQVKLLQVNLSTAWPSESIPPQNAPQEVYSKFYDNLRTNQLFYDVLHAQEKFNCCGAYGKSDYSLYDKSLSVLIKSCCPAEVEKCTPDDAYDDGCLSKVPGYKSWLECERMIQGVAIGFVCLQVMLAASALYFAKATRYIIM